MILFDQMPVDLIYQYILNDRPTLVAFISTSKYLYLTHTINQRYIQGVKLVERSFDVVWPSNQKVDWVLLKKAQAILLGESHCEAEHRKLNTALMEVIWQECDHAGLYESPALFSYASSRILTNSRCWDYDFRSFFDEFIKKIVSVATHVKMFLQSEDDLLYYFGLTYQKLCSKFSFDNDEKAHLEYFINIVNIITNANLTIYEKDLFELKLNISRTALLIHAYTRLERILYSVEHKFLAKIYSLNSLRENKLVAEVLANRDAGKKSIVMAGKAHFVPESTTIKELNKNHINYITLTPKQISRPAIDIPRTSTHAENMQKLKTFSISNLTESNWYILIELCKQFFRVEIDRLKTQLGTLNDLFASQFSENVSSS